MLNRAVSIKASHSRVFQEGILVRLLG